MNKQAILKEFEESYRVLIDSYSDEIKGNLDPDYIECEFSEDYKDMAYEIGFLRYAIKNLIDQAEVEKKEAIEALSIMCQSKMMRINNHIREKIDEIEDEVQGKYLNPEGEQSFLKGDIQVDATLCAKKR